jgi:hypothetical protein
MMSNWREDQVNIGHDVYVEELSERGLYSSTLVVISHFDLVNS